MVSANLLCIVLPLSRGNIGIKTCGTPSLLDLRNLIGSNLSFVAILKAIFLQALAYAKAALDPSCNSILSINLHH
jgi:hypothetical protein